MWLKTPFFLPLMWCHIFQKTLICQRPPESSFWQEQFPTVQETKGSGVMYPVTPRFRRLGSSEGRILPGAGGECWVRPSKTDPPPADSPTMTPSHGQEKLQTGGGNPRRDQCVPGGKPVPPLAVLFLASWIILHKIGHTNVIKTILAAFFLPGEAHSRHHNLTISWGFPLIRLYPLAVPPPCTLFPPVIFALFSVGLTWTGSVLSQKNHCLTLFQNFLAVLSTLFQARGWIQCVYVDLLPENFAVNFFFLAISPPKCSWTVPAHIMLFFWTYLIQKSRHGVNPRRPKLHHYRYLYPMAKSTRQRQVHQ